VFNQPGELNLMEGRHSLAGSLAVGLGGHHTRLVGHHLPRDARRLRAILAGTGPASLIGPGGQGA
jgi:hypothetical protein